MLAQVIDEYGDVDVLRYKDVPTPVPAAGEVRVRVAYAALNPVEWKIRSGAFAAVVPVDFPYILGNEISGVVDEVGPGVTGFAVGARVTGFVKGGADAEYVLTTPDRLALVPQALSLRRAATVPQGAETARRALGLLSAQPGQTVIVNAAAGSVGSAAVQMLVRAGITAIGTAHRDNHDYLRSLGAVPIEHGEGMLDQLAAVGPDGPHAALDAGAKGFVDQALQVLPADRIVTVADFTAADKGVQLAGGDPWELKAESFAPELQLAADGQFATEVATEFALADLADAHRLSKDGHFRGKILVRVAGE